MAETGQPRRRSECASTSSSHERIQPPRIAAVMITATIPNKQPKQAQARPERPAQVGKLI